MTGTRIMIVDDHPVVREGYRRLIELHRGCHIVAEAGNARDAYSTYRSAEPDVTIMDITLPGASGIEALRHILQYDREARVVMFTMHQGAGFALKAMEAGACGYVTKSSDPKYLIQAIDGALSGRIVLSPDIMETVANERLTQDNEILTDLTPRQVEILRLVASGWTADDIAETLSVSTKTVRNNHYQIKTELGLRTDAQLVWFAVRAGIVTLHDTVSG